MVTLEKGARDHLVCTVSVRVFYQHVSLNFNSVLFDVHHTLLWKLVSSMFTLLSNVEYICA